MIIVNHLSTLLYRFWFVSVCFPSLFVTHHSFHVLTWVLFLFHSSTVGLSSSVLFAIPFFSSLYNLYGLSLFLAVYAHTPSTWRKQQILFYLTSTEPMPEKENNRNECSVLCKEFKIGFTTDSKTAIGKLNMVSHKHAHGHVGKSKIVIFSPAVVL